MAKELSRAVYCDCDIIHEDILEEVRAKMPEEGVLYELADLYKVFADSTRVRIPASLSRAMCVCDMAVLLG